MRTETLNNVVFYVSGVVFILHTVGYLAPGWFVREFVVPSNETEFYVDGRQFSLPNVGRLTANTNDGRAEGIAAEDAQTENGGRVAISDSPMETEKHPSEGITDATNGMHQKKAVTNPQQRPPVDGIMGSDGPKVYPGEKEGETWPTVELPNGMDLAAMLHNVREEMVRRHTTTHYSCIQSVNSQLRMPQTRTKRSIGLDSSSGINSDKGNGDHTVSNMRPNPAGTISTTVESELYPSKPGGLGEKAETGRKPDAETPDVITETTRVEGEVVKEDGHKVNIRVPSISLNKTHMAMYLNCINEQFWSSVDKLFLKFLKLALPPPMPDNLPVPELSLPPIINENDVKPHQVQADSAHSNIRPFKPAKRSITALETVPVKPPLVAGGGGSATHSDEDATNEKHALNPELTHNVPPIVKPVLTEEKGEQIIISNCYYQFEGP